MEHSLSGVLGRVLSQNDERLPKINQTKDIERPALIEEMPSEQYHGNRQRMSSTGLRKLLRSPRHFLTFWNGLDDEDQEKDHFRIGRAAHLMLLEPAKFRANYCVQPDFGPMQSKHNRATRDQWRLEQGPEAVIVTAEELDHIVGMIEAVAEHPVAAGMLKRGKPECTITWTDDETGVMCKARPDYLVNDNSGDLHLIDFKTTRDIRPGIFAHSAHRLQYGIQLAYYCDGLTRALGRQPTTITIIAVEKTPPYEAVVFPLTDRWFEHGQERYMHALRIYRKCRDTGIWPAYQTNAQILEMPNSANYDVLPEFEFINN